ncbi:MAG TPA: hypothetical protein VFI95_14670, partial [Terriglobales bacterium]|nr:hypothetical protein [Terriglobales bacterium]
MRSSSVKKHKGVRNKRNGIAMRWCFAVAITWIVTQAAYGQTMSDPQTSSRSATKLAKLDNGALAHSGHPETDVSANPPAGADTVNDPEIPPAIQRQLQIMQERIRQLELQLQQKQSAAQLPSSDPVAKATAGSEAPDQPQPAALQQAEPGVPEKAKPTEPFAYADWTWLNGNARTKDAVF